ncbi:Uncharacterized protein Rs2_29704 [Raphanus sativus]|nr:Uncharacterized protein Rs2_29704 [Raphanus sativus]
MYLPDAVIDLSMTVDELLIPHTGLWDVHKGRQRFVEKDAILILKLKTIQYRQDSLQWGFTKDGTYTSRSGYGFRTPFVPPKSQRLWLLRDHQGRVILHSRRSYSSVQSQEDAELLGTYWAVDCLKTMRFEQIIFESSFRLAKVRLQGHHAAVDASPPIVRDIITKLQQMQAWSLDYAVPSRNTAALKIAESATTYHKYHSYISKEGPSWLHSHLESEANGLNLNAS